MTLLAEQQNMPRGMATAVVRDEVPRTAAQTNSAPEGREVPMASGPRQMYTAMETVQRVAPAHGESNQPRFSAEQKWDPQDFGGSLPGQGQKLSGQNSIPVLTLGGRRRTAEAQPHLVPGQKLLRFSVGGSPIYVRQTAASSTAGVANGQVTIWHITVPLGKHWGTHSSTLRSCGNFETHSPPRLGRRNAVHKSGWQTVTPEKRPCLQNQSTIWFFINYFSPPSWRYSTLTDETVELLQQTWDTVCGLQFGQILRSQIIYWHVPRELQQSYPMQSADLLRYPNPGRSRVLSPEQRPWHHPHTLGRRNQSLAGGQGWRFWGHLATRAQYETEIAETRSFLKKVFHGTRWYKR